MRLFGKYRGLVVDRNDPRKQGRLQVTVPALFGAERLWADPCFPWTGPNAGVVYLPPVGAGVWIEFEGGDPDRPIWVGGWYAAPSGTPETPQEARDGYPDVIEHRTESGFVFVVDESPGQEQVRIEDTEIDLRLIFDRAGRVFRIDHSSGLSIELDVANGRIQMQEKPGPALRSVVDVKKGMVVLTDGEREVKVDRSAGVVRLFDSANQLLLDGAEIMAGQMGGPFYKLLDERFLDVYNNHRHTGYNGVMTSPPDQAGKVDSHTTIVLKGG